MSDFIKVSKAGFSLLWSEVQAAHAAGKAFEDDGDMVFAVRSRSGAEFNDVEVGVIRGERAEWRRVIVVKNGDDTRITHVDPADQGDCDGTL